VNITVERCDEFLVTVPQIFDRVKSVALWSSKKREKKRTIKGYGSAATSNHVLFENNFNGKLSVSSIM
jgi:phage head maturation protease